MNAALVIRIMWAVTTSTRVRAGRNVLCNFSRKVISGLKLEIVENSGLMIARNKMRI